jgi:hypothetical protein
MSFNYQSRSKDLLKALNDAQDHALPPTLIGVLRDRLAACIDRDWMKYLTATERHLNFANMQISNIQSTLYNLLDKTRGIKGLTLSFEIDWDDAASCAAMQHRLVALDRASKIRYLKYAGYTDTDIALRPPEWLDDTLWHQVVSRGHLPLPEQVWIDIGKMYKASEADIGYVYYSLYEEEVDKAQMRDRVIEWMLRERSVPATVLTTKH